MQIRYEEDGSVEDITLGQESVVWLDQQQDAPKDTSDARPEKTASKLPPGAPGRRVDRDSVTTDIKGRKVAVYWLHPTGGGEWYEAVVDGADKSRCVLNIRYLSDDSAEKINIHTEDVVWLRTEGPERPASLPGELVEKQAVEPSLVGRLVAVYWRIQGASDGKWYEAIVEGVNSRKHTLKVQYTEDQALDDVDVVQESVVLLTAPLPSARKKASGNADRTVDDPAAPARKRMKQTSVNISDSSMSDVCEAESNPPGIRVVKEDLKDDVLGRLVAVYWRLPGAKGPFKGQWYEAVVSGLNLRRNSIKIAYSLDSEQDEVDISKEPVVWLENPLETMYSPPEGSLTARDAKKERRKAPTAHKVSQESKADVKSMLGDPVRVDELNSDAIGRQVAVKWLEPNRKDSKWYKGTVQAYHSRRHTLQVKYDEDGYEDDVPILKEEVVWVTEPLAKTTKERSGSTNPSEVMPPGRPVVDADMIEANVGKKVAVLWLEEDSKDGKWYDAVVLSVNARKHSVNVKYDADGMVEDIDFKKEDVVWLPDEVGQKRGRSGASYDSTKAQATSESPQKKKMKTAPAADGKVGAPGTRVLASDLSRDAVGRLVAVYWDLPNMKGAWYEGVIKSVDARRSVLKVVYEEDGTDDSVDVTKEHVAWLDAPLNAMKSAQKSANKSVTAASPLIAASSGRKRSRQAMTGNDDASSPLSEASERPSQKVFVAPPVCGPPSNMVLLTGVTVEPNLVGRRTAVYWPIDKDWYQGVVVKVHADKGTIKVKYDDGEEEVIGLDGQHIACEPAIKAVNLKLKVTTPSNVTSEGTPSRKARSEDPKLKETPASDDASEEAPSSDRGVRKARSEEARNLKLKLTPPSNTVKSDGAARKAKGAESASKALSSERPAGRALTERKDVEGLETATVAVFVDDMWVSGIVLTANPRRGEFELFSEEAQSCTTYRVGAVEAVHIDTSRVGPSRSASVRRR